MKTTRKELVADVILIVIWVAVFVSGWLLFDRYDLPPLDPLGAFPN